MKKSIILTMFFAMVLFPMSSAFASEVSGNVSTSVNTGNIAQTASGNNSEVEATVGNVEGVKVNPGGAISTSVQTGDIAQSSSGYKSKVKLKLGSVEK